MENNIFEKLTPEEQGQLWMYMIFNRDKIKEKTEQWAKEAEEAGMTLTEYLESISPLNDKENPNKSEIPTGSTNTISFKEMTDNLKITAEDIENAEDLEYSIEPLIHSKNDLGVDCISRKAAITPIRPKGRWIDHSDEGYVECPKCGSATNCDDNINDLHFCFSCGAEMEGSEEV